MENTTVDQLKRYYPFEGVPKPVDGGYQNQVYTITIDAVEYILRLSKATTRTYEELEAEVAFCLFLSGKGISLAKPTLSLNRHYIETIDINERVYAVVFEKAIGDKLTYPDYLTNVDLFKTLGEITGKLHNASKALSNQELCRPSWNENVYLKRMHEAIPRSKVTLYDAYHRLLNEIDNLPKHKDVYGLIHGDINVGNFHYCKGSVMLFDFDECQYSWFVEDIAIQLFYTVYVFGDDDKSERYDKAEQFLEAFLTGYTKHMELPNNWKHQMDLFMRLRELILHISIHQKWDFSSLNAWQKDYLRDSGKRIVNDEAVYQILKA